MKPQPDVFATADGTLLGLHDFGGEGPPMLFVHATGMHGWAYRSAAQYFSDRFHCWAIDLRGHGDSAAIDVTNIHWDDFSRDVVAAVAHIADGPVVGVGHSLGGAALVKAAAGNPDDFAGLILFEPAITAPIDELTEVDREYEAMAVGAAERRRGVFGSRALALSNFSRKPPTSDLNSGVLYDYVDHGFADLESGEVRLKCTPHTEAAIYRATSRQSTLDTIGQVSCPVQIFFGSATAPEQEESAIRNGNMFGRDPIRVDSLSHFGPLEHPRHFATAVNRYLASVVATDSE